MPAATLTRPPTTATPQAPRTCWWVIRPEAMPDGRLLGALGMRHGAAKDWYRVTQQTADDFGATWLIEKELADGSFAEGYLVTLPAGGTRPSCTCKGYVYNRECRHTRSLAAATKSL